MWLFSSLHRPISYWITGLFWRPLFALQTLQKLVENNLFSFTFIFFIVVDSHIKTFELNLPRSRLPYSFNYKSRALIPHFVTLWKGFILMQLCHFYHLPLILWDSNAATSYHFHSSWMRILPLWFKEVIIENILLQQNYFNYVLPYIIRRHHNVINAATTSDI